MGKRTGTNRDNCQLHKGEENGQLWDNWDIHHAMDGWMDGWMDGRMVRWMDGWKKTNSCGTSIMLTKKTKWEREQAIIGTIASYMRVEENEQLWDDWDVHHAIYEK